MMAVKTFALGAVGVAALVGGTAPASAQYYPGTPYGYGHTDPGQVIGQVIAQVLNPYGQWGYGGPRVNPQMAANQCSAVVQRQLQTRHRAGYGYGQQYNPYGYGNAYNQARVLGITRVEQRSATIMRVRGVATSGMMAYGQPYGGGYGQPYGGSPYGGGYGGYGGYAQAQAPADLTFRCDVDYRGQIRSVSIDRRY